MIPTGTGAGPGPVRIGVTLPTFREDAVAVDGARRAEALGLDGVFVFDHLWPMGQPERPALAAFPVLGALAVATGRVALGPLVARIGLVPDEVMIGRFRALEVLAPGRVIAGLGTGDTKSAPENAAYGVPVDAPGARRRSLAECAGTLVGEGVPVWIGGGAPATVAVAAAVGAAVNLWDAAPEALTAEAGRTEVTWGGPVPADADGIVARLAPLVAAGATWVVCAWPRSVEAVAEAAAELRRRPVGGVVAGE